MRESPLTHTLDQVELRSFDEAQRILRLAGIPERDWFGPVTRRGDQKINDVVEFEAARQRAAFAIRGTVTGWMPAREFVFPYRGMARRISLLVPKGERKPLPPTPFGWVYWKDIDGQAVLLMPVWLYAIHWLRHNRWELHRRALIPLGFWSLKEEGGYYHEGQWNWRWWRGADRMYDDCVRHWESRTSVPPISYYDYATAVMPAWWFKLGWWFARATAHVKMPRWTT